jgi:hypothetical protein
MSVSAHVSRPKKPCPHEIRVDVAERRVAPGDRIRGRVSVRAGSNERCEDLSIELQLHTHGDVKSVAVVAEQRVFSGDLRAGEISEHDFELEVPIRARPYRGRMFTVDVRLAAVLVTSAWPAAQESGVVKALAGVSTRKLHARPYPIASVPIEVVQPTRAPSLSIDRDRVERGLGKRGESVVVGAIICAIGLVAMIVGAGLALGPVSGGDLWIALIPGGVGALLAVAGGVPFVRNVGPYMAQRKIGVPSIAIEQGQIAVRVPPGSAKGVRTVVRLVEVTVDTRGESNTYTERVIADYPHPLALAGDAFRAAIVVPSDAPPGVDAGAAFLEWRLLVFVDVGGWPDWRAEVPIETGPRAAPQPLVTFE